MKRREAPKKLPWVPLVLLVASVILFWVVPALTDEPQVEVVFEETVPSESPSVGEDPQEQ
ncbi:MAG: hypothetical protein ACOCX1_04150 [Fimbriimonadaceae bacterium]